MALTVKEIENTQPQEKAVKLADERGLYLLISPSGSKHWQLRYSFRGQKKKMSIGPFPEVSLKAARSKRDDARTMIADGIDPLQQRQTQKLEAKRASENNFAAVAREYLGKRADDGDKAIC